MTFAFWEGLGLTCITLGSIVFLDEAVTLRRALGLACVLGGALLVNHGTEHGDEHSDEQAAAKNADTFDAASTATAKEGL